MASIHLPYVIAQGIATVPTVADLPPASVTPIGAIRYVVANDTLYTNDGTAWSPIAGGGGGGVTSVNGQTGVVTLDTDDVPEGATNLYYTNARVDAELLAGKDAVFGNLSATVISNDVNIEDNIIVLDSALVGAPTQNSGIEVNRGTSTDAQILWNETTDTWQAGIVGTLADIRTEPASSASLANTLVLRDGSSNFAAGTITATLNGLANNISGVVAVANGGTGQSNAQAGINNLSNSASTANEGDVFQWLGGNAQFAAYSAPGLTGSPETFAYYNSAGDLTNSNYWILRDNGQVNGGTTFTGNNQNAMRLDANTALGDTWNALGLLSGTLVNSGTNTGYVSLLNFNFNDSGGTTEFINGINIGVQGNTTNDKQFANFYSDGTVGGNLYGLYIDSADDVAGGTNLFSINAHGNYASQLTLANWGNQNAVGDQVRFLDWNNSGTVGNNLSGLFLNSQGAVTRGLDFLSLNVSADVGDGSGINVNGLSINVQNSATIFGGITGVAINNSAPVVGTYTTQGGNLNNQNTGTGYRFAGWSSYNQADFSEEIRGFTHNTQGNSRTSTGIDVYMQGNATDDASGLRVNVTNQTSSTTRVRSFDINGHTFIINGVYRPQSNLFVDSGNNNFLELRVAPGSPITNTDSLINNNIVAFLAEDDVAIGPVGLGLSHSSTISLLGVATGKTVDLVRGTTYAASVQNPGYADAGTITQYEAMVWGGVLPGGGNTAVTNAIGLRMFAGFDSYATNNWGIRVEGATADNYVNKLAVGTPSMTTAAGYLVEVNGKSLYQDQVTTAVGFGLTVLEGSNAKMGADTLVAGTVTVSTTAVTANSRIFHSTQTASGVQGHLSITNIVPGTSFDILSDNALDTSTVAWMIVESV